MPFAKRALTTRNTKAPEITSPGAVMWFLRSSGKGIIDTLAHIGVILSSMRLVSQYEFGPRVFETETNPIVGVRPASGVTLVALTIDTPKSTPESELARGVISAINPAPGAAAIGSPRNLKFPSLRPRPLTEQRVWTSKAGIPQPGPWAASYRASSSFEGRNTIGKSIRLIRNTTGAPNLRAVLISAI